MTNGKPRKEQPFTLDDQIKLAERHVQEGQRIVALQRERIAKGKISGVGADALLITFERTLKKFERHLERLLAERSSD